MNGKARDTVDVAIVGGGSAGLSALRRVADRSGRYVLIDHGPLGTTCARTGCMPSKALLHVANAYYRARGLAEQGIGGTAGLACELPAVLRYVRQMRDRFTRGMVARTRELAGDNLVSGKAKLLGPDRLQVGEREIRAARIILATGAEPMVPGPWRALGDRLLTSDTLFEQEALPRRMALVGLGAIGLELGQALSRLGVSVTGFSLDPTIGGVTDPDVHAAAYDAIAHEFPMHLGAAAEIDMTGDRVRVYAGEASAEVSAVLAAMGVKPRLESLGLESLGVPLDARGLPPVHPQTGQVADLPIYLAGDNNGFRPVLHEALDEGLIAGSNAGLIGDAVCYCRRVPLRIVFSDPQLAVAGQSYAEIQDRAYVTGAADFRSQSRAVLAGGNAGLLHLYIDSVTGHLLGAEMACPEAEHLGHILALAVQADMTVFELLRMPFYHPTVEEALRTALHDAASRMAHYPRKPDLQLCESCAEPPLA